MGRYPQRGVNYLAGQNQYSDINAGEIAVLDAVTPGTVAASKAAVVDSNKDLGDFRNLDCVNLDAGASGVAGSVDVFPSTASKGKTALTAADNTGNTTTTITTAEQAGARTYTVPDAGANASFLMTAGDQTFAEGKDLTLGTVTGSKLGTAVGEKLGFWGATPVIQQASAAQAVVATSGAGSLDGADTVDKAVLLAKIQALEVLVNRLRLDLVTTGIIKGAA